MNLSLDTVFYLGYIPTGIFVVIGFGKGLRKDALLQKLLLIALAFASTGFFVRIDDRDIGAGFAPAVFATPLVYLLSYAFLRFLYKARYKREPTYNRASWYDEEEGRRQNGWDFLVHLLPLIFSSMFPLFFLGN